MSVQEIILGDCLDVLKQLADKSIDCVVTDPPYGLEFMSKTWDAPWKQDEASWRESAGMSRPGIGERAIEWPSYGGGDTANATCGQCGGRMRGTNKCSCEVPDWRVRGEKSDATAKRVESMRGFQAWCEVWAREALRVLKPGGHLLAFGGTRTYHRLASAIEDAGFEIRDSVLWLYGSGFPKSMNISLNTDKIARGTPQGTSDPQKRGRGDLHDRTSLAMGGGSGKAVTGLTDEYDPYEAQTDDAKLWEGWGTALKPSHEPIVVARKPVVGTVVANVLKYGTGAININATRISTGPSPLVERRRHAAPGVSIGATGWKTPARPASYNEQREGEQLGRWPANVAFVHLDECERVGERKIKAAQNAGGPAGATHNGTMGDFAGTAKQFDYSDADGNETVEVWCCAEGCPVAELDAQSGAVGAAAASGPTLRDGNTSVARGKFNGLPEGREPAFYADKGGASRFFKTVSWTEEEKAEQAAFMYCAKAARSEREAGCENLPARSGVEAVDREEGSAGTKSPRAGAGRTASTVRNAHPTVKPIKLLQWLLRMVTPPGGVVLDPFVGSGTTLCAAALENVNAIGIDREPDYVKIAQARLQHWQKVAKNNSTTKIENTDDEIPPLYESV